MPTAITDATFEQEVLKADLPVLVDFWAPWCGPCRMMNPIVEELSSEYAGTLKVAKMNVEENRQIPGMLGVMSIPTFALFKGGKPVKAFAGAQPKQAMKEQIDAALAA